MDSTEAVADRFVWPSNEGPPPEHGWVCFHCGLICETPEQAAEHFGNPNEARWPPCFATGTAWLLAREAVRGALADLGRGSVEVADARLREALRHLSFDGDAFARQL